MERQAENTIADAREGVGRQNTMQLFRELNGLFINSMAQHGDQPMLSPTQWIRVAEIFEILSEPIAQMGKFWRGVEERARREGGPHA